MQQLFQEETHRDCTYTLHKNRSFTDSRESYQNGVSKEVSILRRNGRVPTKEVVWHLLKVLPAEDINALRLKVFRYLKDHGLEAVASVELTRGANGQPNGCVHFHVLLDDTRSEADIRALFNKACERDGFVQSQDFRIDYRKLYDGKSYFYYYAKCGKKHFDKVILFQPKLLKSGKTLQKFYQIGKWFHKSKELLWEEIKSFMASKYGTDPDEVGNSDETE